MEATVQLFRTLANRPRMRILRVLAVLGEQRVTAISDATGIQLCTVSGHLHALAVSGIVWRRRSGRAVYYHLAEEPSRHVTRCTASVLRRVFGRVHSRDPRHVAACDQADSAEFSDAALFSYFTAFTHPRRLQIVRYLHENGRSRADRIATDLHMSAAACSRHTAKLVRRDLVRVVEVDGAKVYELTGGRSVVQSELVASVVQELTATH